MEQRMTRRDAMKSITGAAALAAGTGALPIDEASAGTQTASPLKGNINHSVSRWCYNSIPFEEFSVAVREMGIKSIELLEVGDFETLKKHGLVCAMVSGVPGGITNGLNDMENHDGIVRFFEETAPLVADAGFRNIICFSGNRRGMPDEQGLENCARGLGRIIPICEKYDVVAVMELLNSKRSHRDYMCDYTRWGVELCKRVGSDRFGLLYDIFHMQIMEGDVIATIRENHEYIFHYHTGGVPGRNEIDETQELYYPAIMRAIMETGFDGFVGQEFVPSRPDKLASLHQAIQICDV